MAVFCQLQLVVLNKNFLKICFFYFYVSVLNFCSIFFSLLGRKMPIEFGLREKFQLCAKVKEFFIYHCHPRFDDRWQFMEVSLSLCAFGTLFLKKHKKIGKNIWKFWHFAIELLNYRQSFEMQPQMLMLRRSAILFSDLKSRYAHYAKHFPNSPSIQWS